MVLYKTYNYTTVKTRITCMFCVVAVKVSFCLVLISTDGAYMPSHLVRMVNHFHMIVHTCSLHVLSTYMALLMRL